MPCRVWACFQGALQRNVYGTSTAKRIEYARKTNLSRGYMSTNDSNAKYETLRLTKRHLALLFDSVIEMYVRAKFTNPLSASNPDPDSRSFKWTHGLVEFIADVESATESVLRDPAEQAIWHQLSIRAANQMGAVDSPEPHAISLREATDVIQKCARLYFDRGLEPKSYFIRVKRRAEDSK
jgi:hypothetical protein